MKTLYNFMLSTSRRSVLPLLCLLLRAAAMPCAAMKVDSTAEH
jgi:hypothetical protein